MIEVFVWMSYYRGMKLMLTLKDEAACDIEEIAERISKLGLKVLAVNAALGIIEVKAQPDRVMVLEELPGIDSIEQLGESVRVAPPDSEIQ